MKIDLDEKEKDARYLATGVQSPKITKSLSRASRGRSLPPDEGMAMSALHFVC